MTEQEAYQEHIRYTHDAGKFSARTGTPDR